MTPLDLRDAYLVVMTGAGVSAESGVPTFRDANGLWEQHRVEDVASPEGFHRDPTLVWRFYSTRRERAVTCSPNPGHLAIARVEAALRDRFLLVTQNVDGLHRRAGSERLVEIHGNLFTSRCTDDRCSSPPFADDRSYVGVELPRCDRCGALVRPHIVWFGETLDPEDLRRIELFFAQAKADGQRLIYVACGTSGVVYPAAGLVSAARAMGAETVLVNLEAPANARSFDRIEFGRSGEILPRLFGGEAR